MQISNLLPQFDEEKTLLVVLGRKAGIFYYAHQGELEKLEDFDVELESYTDREGFFESSWRGKTTGSGAPLKDNQKHLKTKFLKTVTEKLADLAIQNDIKAIYLFSPKDLIPPVLEAIDSDGKIKKEIVRETIPGNMTKKHPTELLKLISELLEEKSSLKTK